jgi:hypothetical protein
MHCGYAHSTHVRQRHVPTLALMAWSPGPPPELTGVNWVCHMTVSRILHPKLVRTTAADMRMCISGLQC